MPGLTPRDLPAPPYEDDRQRDQVLYITCSELVSMKEDVQSNTIWIRGIVLAIVALGLTAVVSACMPGGI